MTVEEQQKNENKLKEKERKKLWVYVTIGIATIVCFVTVAALSYGIINAEVNAQGERIINFPMLLWAAGLIVLPSALVLVVHHASSGLFTPSQKTLEEEEAWQQQLPDSVRRGYTFLKDAPGIVLLVLLFGGGVALVTIDGAFSALIKIASIFEPYIAHIVISFAVVLCCMLLSVAWLKYRSRQISEEYAFRREIFERSGIVIVDKQSMALPARQSNEQGFAVLEGSAKEVPQALPEGNAKKVSEMSLAEDAKETSEILLAEDAKIVPEVSVADDAETVLESSLTKNDLTTQATSVVVEGRKAKQAQPAQKKIRKVQR